MPKGISVSKHQQRETTLRIFYNNDTKYSELEALGALTYIALRCTVQTEKSLVASYWCHIIYFRFRAWACIWACRKSLGSHVSPLFSLRVFTMLSLGTFRYNWFDLRVEEEKRTTTRPSQNINIHKDTQRPTWLDVTQHPKNGCEGDQAWVPEIY